MRPGDRLRHCGGLPRGAGLIDRATLTDRLRRAGCVFAEDEARLLLSDGRCAGDLEALVVRREAGEPLEVVLGWVDFLGVRLRVGPGVFVPRTRTELLARLAQRQVGRGAFLELCCGVAPVAAAVQRAHPTLEVHAADIDPAILTCATDNLPHGRIHLGDLYAALPTGLRGRLGVIAANAPYVPDGAVSALPPEARLHEPITALAGGPEGLSVQRRVVADAVAWLGPAGVLLVETGQRQAALTAQLMSEAGLATTVEVDPDIGGCVVVGVRPGEPA